ncbi:MAG: MarR family transcriptional regulator [Tunicatimonas sp.]
MKTKKRKGDNSLTTLLSKSARLMSNRLNKNLLSHEVTAEQWAVLSSLWKQNGQTQQALANHANKNKASITHLIDNLEKRRLVERLIDESDRRNKLVHLTPEGSKLQESLTKVVNKTVKEMTADVDKKELKQCKRALRKMVDTLLEADSTN